MLEGKLEFIPITEVKVFVSLSNFISKFPLYFSTTRLILLVPIPCIPDVLLEDTRVPSMYLGFLLQEFEILMITKLEFLVLIEKSIKIQESLLKKAIKIQTERITVRKRMAVHRR